MFAQDFVTCPTGNCLPCQVPSAPRRFTQQPACMLTVTQPLHLAPVQRMWQGHMQAPAVRLFRPPPFTLAGLRCAASRTCIALSFSPCSWKMWRLVLCGPHHSMDCDVLAA